MNSTITAAASHTESSPPILARVYEAPACTQGAVHMLRSHGYIICDGLASQAVVDQVDRELDPWFAATPRCQGDFYGWKTTRLGSVLLKSAAAQSLLLNEQVHAILAAILRPNCDWYQLNLTQAVRIHPGERQQVPHRDEEMWPCQKNGVEYLVNVMWPLSDFTEENGATMIWPGSHFSPLMRQCAPEGAVRAEMRPGSALIFLGSATHCAGANRSNAPRTGLILSFCLGWLKQYENAFLSYPPDVAQKFPPAVRDLLGYRIHRPNLGCYEGQDPAVLFETRSHTLAAVDAVPEGIAAELSAYYGEPT